MQIGDIVRLPVELGEHEHPVKEGRVVYIHPKGRFFVAEFQGGCVTYRQAYKL